jgi:hypothetical protein
MPQQKKASPGPLDLRFHPNKVKNSEKLKPERRQGDSVRSAVSHTNHSVRWADEMSTVRSNSRTKRPGSIDVAKANNLTTRIDARSHLDEQGAMLESDHTDGVRGSPEYPPRTVMSPTTPSRARVPKSPGGVVRARRSLGPPSSEDLLRVPGYTPTSGRPARFEAFPKFQSSKRLSLMSLFSATSLCGDQSTDSIASSALAYQPQPGHRKRSAAEKVRNLFSGKS